MTISQSNSNSHPYNDVKVFGHKYRDTWFPLGPSIYEVLERRCQIHKIHVLCIEYSLKHIAILF